MKIGITCYPTYGGSGAVATELGIALAARGHEVHFITYAQPFRLPSFLPRVYFHEVDVGRYPLFEYPPYDLALAVRMHEVVRDHQLDVLAPLEQRRQRTRGVEGAARAGNGNGVGRHAFSAHRWIPQEPGNTGCRRSRSCRTPS